MDRDEIKLKQKESLLKEAIYEAMSTLGDERINSLGIVEVYIKKGKYDADVYLDPTGLNESEQKEALKALRKAEGVIKRQITASTDWFRSPALHFKFDTLMEEANKIERLLEKISKND